MITEQDKQLARQMMDFARQKGCSACRISLGTGTENEFEYRNTQLEKLQQSSQNYMRATLFVDGRYGAYSTNRIELNELKKFIGNAIDSTRYLAEDPHRQLPPLERCYKGKESFDECYDSQFDTVRPDDKLNAAKAAAAEVYGSDPRIVSVTANYFDSDWFSYMIDSNGFEGQQSQTSYSLSAEVSIKGDGDARPESWWYDSALFWQQLKKEGIGRKALERVMKKLGQKKIKSGKYPMLVDNMNSSRLLSPLISAMNGEALAQKNSFLADMLGKKIASDKLTLADEPHLPKAQGARRFDGEGVATQRRAVIEGGVLQTYFIDTYNANRLNMPPTVSGASVLTLKTGNKDLDGLAATLSKGILVTGFNGGNSNSNTGDFSFGVEGFLVERGKLVKPVSEMNVTGNLLALWANLQEVGNDVRLNSSWRMPSLLFDDVSFSGL
ncbi:MAG: TldD/PmbA family protein [Prevotellaceae bacterium]|jgi:PmbA protein|nr:TldD/PmbA family protein [Prevotellaceae bacterium]